jgi:hypothetical protein
MLDYLNVSPDEAAANNPSNDKKGGKKEKDARLFSPNINNADKEYQAKVRQLPQGLDGLKNKLPVSVEQHTHFIKEPAHKLYLTVKCRKTLGPKEHCPICDANWKIYNAAKDVNDKPMMDKAKSRMAKVSHIGNFLIRDDINTPENNGRVMLWRHTSRMQKTLLEPTLAEGAGEEKRGFKKAKERFVPYSPVNGKDFFVIVTENPENQFPSYDGSYWDEDGLSNLAESEDKMMSYLEQCHDLREFIDDVESAEELTRKYMEFNAKLEERMQGGGPSGYTNNAPAQNAPVNETSGSDYFNQPAVDAPASTGSPFDMNAEASTSDEPMLGDSIGDEEEDLPF